MYIDYALAYGIDDCAFHGVRKDGQKQYGCGTIWDAYKREQLFQAIERALEKIELHMGIPLGNKFVCEEQLPYNYKTGLVGPTKWTQVLATGIKAETDYGNFTVDYDTDPIEIQTATAATDPCEIKIYHLEDVGGGEIDPTIRWVRGRGYIRDITISGGVATIYIPRCHLVDPTLDQPENGFDYTDLDNFVRQVNVKRVYIDTTQGTVLVYRPSICGTTGPCTNVEQEACAVVQNKDTGLMLVRPAAYSSGAWATSCFSGETYPYAARVSYIAGFNDPCSALCDQIPASLVNAVLRLAHTEMPQAVCGCTIHNESWQLDRQKTEEFLAWDVLRNPFGTLQGQIYAYKTLKLFMTGQAGVF